MADAVGGAQVGSDRRLPIGSRPYEVKPPARAEDTGTEAGHEVSAFVPRADKFGHDRILER